MKTWMLLLRLNHCFLPWTPDKACCFCLGVRSLRFYLKLLTEDCTREFLDTWENHWLDSATIRPVSCSVMSTIDQMIKACPTVPMSYVLVSQLMCVHSSALTSIQLPSPWYTLATLVLCCEDSIMYSQVTDCSLLELDVECHSDVSVRSCQG